MDGVMWDNKKGWSIPRNAIDDVPMTILSCAAMLEGKQHYSTTYLIHPIGKKEGCRGPQPERMIWTTRCIKGNKTDSNFIQLIYKQLKHSTYVPFQQLSNCVSRTAITIY